MNFFNFSLDFLNEKRGGNKKNSSIHLLCHIFLKSLIYDFTVSLLVNQYHHNNIGLLYNIVPTLRYLYFRN